MRRALGICVAATLAILIASAGAPRPAAADGVVRSEVDARRIGIDDQLQLTITVEASDLPDQVAPPPLTNLRVVGGPGVSTQMSWVNGRASQLRSWTYVLQPTAVGNAEVGIVAVQLRTGETSAPAIPIEVVAGSVKPAEPQRGSSPFDEDPFGSFFGRRRGPEPKLFVEAQPSRTSLYVGEPLLLTYYLYTQASVSGLQLAQAPQYAGFWAEDLTPPGRSNGEPATVEGVSYRRFPVMRKLLFPTKAGRLTIPPATLSIGVASQSPFDNGAAVQRSTKPVTVEVKPVPEEPGSSGAVGRFKATASLDRPSLAFGEAATLRFKVEGSGNLKWVDRGPELTVPGARVYPPQVKSDLQAEPTGITGSRTWEYVVVPQTAGTLEIPRLEFEYFDPAAGRVARSATAPLTLRVEGGTPASAAPPPLAGPGPAARGGPLPLRADLEQGSRGAALPGSAVGFIAAGVLALHGLMWGGGRLARLGRRGRGRAAAPRSVRGAIGDLQRVGRDGMSKEKAAGLIEKTIHSVFGSLDGDESERARAVRDLLDEVHAVRYAPQLGDYSEKLRELAARAGDVIRRWA
ncbi:MAG TPA: BatD family protein [Candidatus Eisenbacteria bacterium]